MEWPLLASLSEDEQREFVALARRRQFAKNEVVCHAGDPADSLHLVTSGRLSVRVSLPSGDTAMINVLRPGSYFGELALLREDNHRTATITALETDGDPGGRRDRVPPALRDAARRSSAP